MSREQNSSRVKEEAIAVHKTSKTERLLSKNL